MRRLWLLIKEADTEIVELLLGVLALNWGLLILAPFDTFGSTPSFRVMASAAPEPVWGSALFIAGVLHICGLARNHRHTRQAAAFFTFLCWMVIAISFGLANPQGTAMAVYPTLALLSAWAYVRLAREGVQHEP